MSSAATSPMAQLPAEDLGVPLRPGGPVQQIPSFHTVLRTRPS
jgi:hypothetical protein